MTGTAVGMMPKDHLIIVGYGINGRNLARSARAEGIPYVIVDMDPEKLPHFVAQRHHLFIADDGGYCGVQAEGRTPEELIGRDARPVGHRQPARTGENEDQQPQQSAARH